MKAKGASRGGVAASGSRRLGFARYARPMGPPPPTHVHPPVVPPPMSLPTLFAPDLAGAAPGTAVELDTEQARHVRALRLRPGEDLRVTDGRGRVWSARLEETGKDSATCVLESEERAPAPLPVELAIPVAHRGRTLWLVEKAVELGAVSLQPIEFHRSRSVADAARSRGFWKKAHRRAIAALKQCGGALLPEIGPVRELEAYLERRVAAPGTGPPGASTDPDEEAGVCLTGGADRTLREALAAWTGSGLLRVLIGPEGGLVETERAASREAGFTAASLGPRTLRFETAAVAALSVAGQQAAGVGAGERGEPKVGRR